MKNEELKKYFDSEAGKSLKEYLLKEVQVLESIYNVKDCSNAEDQALELKSQKKALWLIDNILGKVMVLDKEQVEEPKYHVGVDDK